VGSSCPLFVQCEEVTPSFMQLDTLTAAFEAHSLLSLHCSALVSATASFIHVFTLTAVAAITSPVRSARQRMLRSGGDMGQ